MARIDEKTLYERLQNPQTRRRAFEEVVNCYSRRLYWQIHYVVQNHQDADDVLQNTMLKAWKAIGEFKGDSNISTWLFRIAYNESITWVKQRKESMSIDDDDFVETTEYKADEYFDGDDADRLLQEAMATLPAKQKLVFGMKYYEDKKYEEISEILGTSIGALKASYHIAVEKITNYVKRKQ